jgi:hypothetical protein
MRNNAPGNIHHLRVKVHRLRQRPFLMAQVIGDIYTLPGVVSVAASPLTGALLVRYHGAMDEPGAFWRGMEQVLDAHGLNDARPPPTSVHSQGTPQSSAANLLADMLLKTLANRACKAIIAAVL